MTRENPNETDMQTLRLEVVKCSIEHLERIGQRLEEVADAIWREEERSKTRAAIWPYISDTEEPLDVLVKGLGERYDRRGQVIDDLRAELDVVIGGDHEHLPYSSCSHCGRRMVWDDPSREMPVWMCPRCVHRRMVVAEERVHKADGMANEINIQADAIRRKDTEITALLEGKKRLELESRITALRWAKIHPHDIGEEIAKCQADIRRAAIDEASEK